MDSGMSNNAVDAYADGVRPLSSWTLDLLREGGWEETRKLAMHLAATGFWSSYEWHHSGGTWYNKVDFYDIADLIGMWAELTEDEREQHRASAKKPKPQEEGQKVSGHYTLWGGSRRRPTKVGKQDFTGVKVGYWIHMDGGGRKKAFGNHIYWQYV